MSTNPHQLFLLADHIKLSLLERQRAISLNLEPNKQDGHISRSLETLREGIEALEQQQDSDASLGDQLHRLRTQYSDLSAQFHGPANAPPTSSTLTSPNDPSLQSDFAAANSTQTPHSSLRHSNRSASKSVRFRDNPSPSPADDANRAALFPYRDNPEDVVPDQSQLDNQQIHAYHKQVIRDQDEQLDRLGESIGRQRELSIQMGNELDEQVELLDDVDEGVDRHQGQLDRAKKRLDRVARGARENWSWTLIAILIIILVLLIIILK